MLKNRIFRRLSLVFSVLLLLASTVNSTFCFIVTQTDSIVNTFVPFYGAVGNLLLGKTVQHSLGEDYVIPEHICFDFYVELGGYYANAELKTSAGTVTADENGAVVVSVRPGQPIVIEGIESGTKVSVTELEKDGDGFTVKDSILTKEATVLHSVNTAVEFVNVYAPKAVQPVNIELTGTKILEGRDWQTGDSFSFTLEQRTDDGQWLSLGAKSVTYDPQSDDFNAFDFTDTLQSLVFDKVGTYTFRMTEVIGQQDGIDYDKSINTFKVQVTDADMDGSLEIGGVTVAQNATVNQKNGSYHVAVTFNNTYIPAVPDPEDIQLSLTVCKTMDDRSDSGIGVGGFRFALENAAAGFRATRETDEAGLAVFNLAFTAEDIGKTYTYQLSEIDEGMPGVTYDPTVYSITVSIVLVEGNELAAYVTVDGAQTQSLTFEFANTYYVDPVDPNPTGDGTHLYFWLVLMIASGVSCLILLCAEKKYKGVFK